MNHPCAATQACVRQGGGHACEGLHNARHTKVDGQVECPIKCHTVSAGLNNEHHPSTLQPERHSGNMQASHACTPLCAPAPITFPCACLKGSEGKVVVHHLIVTITLGVHLLDDLPGAGSALFGGGGTRMQTRVFGV